MKCVVAPALLACIASLAAVVSASDAQDPPPSRPGESPRRQGSLIGEMTAFKTDVPAHDLDVILVNPTDRSIDVTLASSTSGQVLVEYWRDSSSLRHKSAAVAIDPGDIATIPLTGLAPGARYHYRVAIIPKPGAAPRWHTECHFRTRPAPHTPFTFTIQADSHLDQAVDTDVYLRTLASALADEPDFHIDLGDTFMTDKRGKDFKAALPQYVAQRYYFGQLCHSAPLFLVLGNHDGEWGYASSTEDDMAPWSFAQRTRYFPPPAILDNADGNAVYTGRTTRAKTQGANYYSFTWGDAQFIVLDPFWFTNDKMRGPGGRSGQPARTESDTALSDQNWTLTLGREQYDWLSRTLETSHSAFRFVFIHHLVGGRGRASRGGVESAPYFEWGGSNADGTDGFTAHRPGWPLPIHQLLVKHHVAAVFHGHDHLYVHNQLGGVTYQCVPQPGNPSGGTKSASEYGYQAGTILPSPGYLRVQVAPKAARIQFVRTVIAQKPQDQKLVVDSYEIPAFTPN